MSIITWLLVPLFNAWMDRKGAKRNYLFVNTLRGIAMIMHAVIFFHPEGGYNFFGDLWQGFPYLIFYFGSYWIVFELALNILTGRTKRYGWEGLLYYDQKEGDSGWIDRLFKWAGEEAHFWAKVIVSFATVVSVMIIIYTR
jgi:hypothetical protein